ncbi:MAG: Holliday junction resolvase Hjc [Sulfolobales archaeon]|nr:Holliday junction resolvase Hjc [Sulfolobales archaeon]MCX8186260.1 Holliday junction resolvase Hjc [Sulfolobales archaeon]MDW7969004.1 Holliday junction resolvase Hjc [Sulfolobales archaeon]
MRRIKGYVAERELVIKLWKLGFAVMRAPASGAKIKKAKYPDLIAIKSSKVLVFEVKSRSKAESIYINGEQIRKLRDFADRAGGHAFIVVKISGDKWRAISLEQLEKVNDNTYKISKDALLSSKHLDELLRELKLISSLEEFIK